MRKYVLSTMRALFVCSVAGAVAIAAGCSGDERTGEAAAGSSGAAGGGAEPAGAVRVVTSFFPLYDFAKTIGGENADVVNMIPTGVEPHDWTPKSQDMVAVSRADLFVYQGGGFEGWTEDVLGGVDADSLVVVEASRGIELMAASESGSEAAHAHEGESGEHADEAHADEAHTEDEAHADEAHGEGAHGEAEAHGEAAHDHGDTDPHTWLSPRSALVMAQNVLDGFKAADPENAAVYEANFAKLKADLEALDRKYAEQLGAATNKEMVVSHQAFGYLARDYGLVQMPILGIASDGEPTAQDLKAISEFVKEHGVKYIFTEELVSNELAETLANDLGVQTLPLHPLEGLTEREAQAGETYVSLMEKNLDALVSALK